MPWCPKCKNEYKEGIQICADCGCELVDSLEEQDIPVYFGSEEEIDNMISFLEANQISGVLKQYDEEEDIFELVAKSKDSDEVKRIIRVYLMEVAKKDTDEEETPKKRYVQEVYADTGKRAQEYKSGAYTLLLVGGIGIIALILINTNIIPLNLPQFTRILVTGVMGLLFVIFAVLGAASLKTCHALESQADNENQKEKEILDWFQKSVTKEMIDQDIAVEEETEEVLYFKRTEKMRSYLKETYPDEKENFMEYLIEKLYSTLFE